MEKVYREIGGRIRALRKALGLTQAEVAERAAIDPSFYGQIERGSSIPSLRTLYAVAGVLAVEPADLLPGVRSRGPRERIWTDALSPTFSRLSPRRRELLMGMVRELARELDR